MKHSYLFFGCLFFLSNWIVHPIVFIVFYICMILYYRHHYVFSKVSILLFSLLLGVWVYPHTPSKPISKRLHIKEIKSKYVIADNGEQRVIVYGLQGVSFDDVVDVQGTYTNMDSIHNIRSFSFSNYLQRRHIYYQINVSKTRILKKGGSLRHHIYQRISNFKNKQQRNWILSMLFGIHEDDVSFFVTSSGMHISYLFSVFEKGLRMFCSVSVTQLITLFGIGICGYSSVFTSSLLRVLCFRLVRFVAPDLAHDDTIGVSMMVILVVFPYMAYELAFLLPVGFQLLQLFNVQKRKKLLTSYTILVPIQYLFFHTCNPIQILLFRYVRVVYAWLYMVSWLLFILPNETIFSCILAIQNILQKIEQIGFSLYYTPSYVWLLLWLYYMVLYISYQGRHVYVLCVLFLYAPLSSYMDPFGEIVMLDVGQGDCSVVKLPFHQGVLLIDVMGSLYKDVPSDIIVPSLKAMGIHSIDKVIITHKDYDHSGGLKQLQKQIPVKEVITKKQTDTQLGSLHIPFVIPNYEGKDENENSIITYIDVYGLRMLFMGDAGEQAEQVLIQTYPNLQVDVVKVGHHGSATSSSLAFLHSIQPQLALISAGRNNRYGHPHKETLHRLQQENIYYLSTPTNGAVSIKFCKYFAFFRTADNEFGIIRNR